jgi:hypothetical protein
MKLTTNQLKKIIKEEISNIQEEDNAYDAISADLDLVMKSIPLETAIDIVKGYLEVEDLIKIVLEMPEVEMTEIYDLLNKKRASFSEFFTTP